MVSGSHFKKNDDKRFKSNSDSFSGKKKKSKAAAVSGKPHLEGLVLNLSPGPHMQLCWLFNTGQHNTGNSFKPLAAIRIHSPHAGRWKKSSNSSISDHCCSNEVVQSWVPAPPHCSASSLVALSVRAQSHYCNRLDTTAHKKKQKQTNQKNQTTKP